MRNELRHAAWLTVLLLAACGGSAGAPPCQPSQEICDAKDNDCDGQVDEGLGVTTCGAGACQRSVPACDGGVPGVCTPGGAQPETCNGIDDDCDGQLDEGCDCLPGQTQDCYTGPPITLGVGACHAGQQACEAGVWGACAGDLLPAAETCNGSDDDCNGLTDDGLGDISCGLGACARAVAACSGGTAGTCTPGDPTEEVCNGLDDDCDGETDEGNPGGGASCATGLAGVCAAGTATCRGGAVTCVQHVQPSAETCDGLDNDCNGQVDDGVGPTYHLDVDRDGYGDPASSVQACSQPAGWVSDGTDCNDASAAMSPGAVEVCNGVDDDCDTFVDEGNPGGGAACLSGLQGRCAAGTTACQGGTLTCTANVAPSAEVCNAMDDDCDGTVDNGNPGGGASCLTGQPGACSAGTTACQGGALACVPNVGASAEVCNGVDDDCDGTVDNGNPGGGGACLTGQLGVCSPGTTACQAGTLACVGNVAPSAEACDALDNDCDGQIDEGVRTTYFRDADGDGFGSGASTIQACTQPPGYVSNAVDCNDVVAAIHPGATELCNGVDDDCDAVIDEGNPGGGVACLTGQLGVCSPGTSACQAGALTCLRNVAPSAEVCDGLDNDCDGVVDNGGVCTP